MGLIGVFLLMVGESACLPIPSEATMLFAGFNVSEGEYSLFVATAVGVVANVVGSWIAYAIGYFGRVDLIEKHGRKVFIKPHHLKWADNWFEKYGDATVFFSRMPADHPHLHLAARRRRADAVLALHDPHRARLHPVGVHARLHRQAGRRPLGELEGQPALHRLRGRRGDHPRRDLAVPALPQAARRRIRPDAPDASSA